MEIHYTPKGVCSRQINIVVEDGVIQSVKFTGGCSGNTQGVAALAKGMKGQGVFGALPGHPLRRQAHLLPGTSLAQALFSRP